MRYREVKKGMSIKIYRILPSNFTSLIQFVGKEGKVEYIHAFGVHSGDDFPVKVKFRGIRKALWFSHKELQHVKPTFLSVIKDIGYDIIELQKENRKLKTKVKELRKELKAALINSYESVHVKEEVKQRRG